MEVRSLYHIDIDSFSIMGSNEASLLVLETALFAQKSLFWFLSMVLLMGYAKQNVELLLNDSKAFTTSVGHDWRFPMVELNKVKEFVAENKDADADADANDDNESDDDSDDDDYESDDDGLFRELSDDDDDDDVDEEDSDDDMDLHSNGGSSDDDDDDDDDDDEDDDDDDEEDDEDEDEEEEKSVNPKKIN